MEENDAGDRNGHQVARLTELCARPSNAPSTNTKVNRVTTTGTRLEQNFANGSTPSRCRIWLKSSSRKAGRRTKSFTRTFMGLRMLTNPIVPFCNIILKKSESQRQQSKLDS